MADHPPLHHASTLPSAHTVAGAATESALEADGIHPSHASAGTSSPGARPHLIHQLSAPAGATTLSRHHVRAPSRSKRVKETLNARSHYGSGDDGGASVHRINQYVIKQEIGRGSFGSVHLAVDQYGTEYAVKEFSKARLRKRVQSSLLRRPQAGRRPNPGHSAGHGFNSPLHRLQEGQPDTLTVTDSLGLIREEIAIMKKLDHGNLVSLIEVLDDPHEDSLYMVLEYCKKGVVMHVGLDERAEPYSEEACRCWFRDMLLGIEYLHHQGIIHRDIKPDNCLITEDDVLKIVDFGVSEMFEKESEMATAKSAGSPAFMPPELCVVRHGQVSGRAADIWSMGVTLYCLRYGHIPFEKAGMLDLYDSIRSDEVHLDNEQDDNFRDLMHRLLEKDPTKRITMPELRDHPWVTCKGTDPLLSVEENCADLVDPPTEAEMDHAITGNMAYLLVVMKAVKRFKALLHNRQPQPVQSILGGEGHLVAPPHAINEAGAGVESPKPSDAGAGRDVAHGHVPADHDVPRPPRDTDSPGIDAAGGLHRRETEPATSLAGHLDLDDSSSESSDEPVIHHFNNKNNAIGRAHTFPVDDRAKGHAHNPLLDTLFLHIGPYPDLTEARVDPMHPIVSESPPAVEMNIYEQAYQDEMKKILERRGKGGASMYLTRRVEHREDLRSHSNIFDSARHAADKALGMVGKFEGLAIKRGGGGGIADLIKRAREKERAGAETGADDGDGKGDQNTTDPLPAASTSDDATGKDPQVSVDRAATAADRPVDSAHGDRA